MDTLYIYKGNGGKKLAAAPTLIYIHLLINCQLLILLCTTLNLNIYSIID